MGETTGILWTRHSYNAWWGCVKVEAPGDEPSECDNCYAESGSVRFGFSEQGAHGPALWGKDSERRRFGDAHWNEPRTWDAAARAAGRRELTFCNSYGDVFEARDDLDAERARLFALIEETPNLVWQLLTKRPEHVRRLVPHRWQCGVDDPAEGFGWPSNVWIGTSVGTQRSADIRVPRLLEIPAPVRFLSCEPLLGPVDLSPWLHGPACWLGAEGFGECTCSVDDESPIGWVIVELDGETIQEFPPGTDRPGDVPVQVS